MLGLGCGVRGQGVGSRCGVRGQGVVFWGLIEEKERGSGGGD